VKTKTVFNIIPAFAMNAAIKNASFFCYKSVNPYSAVKRGNW